MIRGAWTGKERREAERCKILVPCKLLVGPKIWMGKTDDISLRGAYFAPGEGEGELSGVLRHAAGVFELLLPTAVFRTDCRVVRTSTAGIGLEFIGHHGTDAYDTLLDFLETQLSRVR